MRLTLSRSAVAERSGDTAFGWTGRVEFFSRVALQKRRGAPLPAAVQDTAVQPGYLAET